MELDCLQSTPALNLFSVDLFYQSFSQELVGRGGWEERRCRIRRGRVTPAGHGSERSSRPAGRAPPAQDIPPTRKLCGRGAGGPCCISVTSSALSPRSPPERPPESWLVCAATAPLGRRSGRSRGSPRGFSRARPGGSPGKALAGQLPLLRLERPLHPLLLPVECEEPGRLLAALLCYLEGRGAEVGWGSGSTLKLVLELAALPNS